MQRTLPPQILLIEDDDIDALALERAFRREAFESPLLRARSAEEALKILRDQDLDGLPKPSVALLDLNLPGMDGHAFLKTVREDPELRPLVVFVLSTSIDPTDVERAYQQQAAGYFVKAIDAGRNDEVLEALRAYLAVSVLPSDL